MKKFTQILTALVFCSLVVFVSCKKKSSSTPEDPRDAAGLALEERWVATSVTKDDIPREEWLTSNFEVTFTYNTETDAGSYILQGVPDNTGAPDVWGSNVTWSFLGEDEAGVGTIVVTYDNNIETTMNIQLNEAETELEVRFTITEASARTSGFNGDWVFNFTAQ